MLRVDTPPAVVVPPVVIQSQSVQPAASPAIEPIVEIVRPSAAHMLASDRQGMAYRQMHAPALMYSSHGTASRYAGDMSGSLLDIFV